MNCNFCLSLDVKYLPTSSASPQSHLRSIPAPGVRVQTCMVLLFCLQGRPGKQSPGWRRRASSSSSVPPLGFHLLLRHTRAAGGGLSLQSSSLQLSLVFKGLPGVFCTTHPVPVFFPGRVRTQPQPLLPAQARHLVRLISAGGGAASPGSPHVPPQLHR